MSKEIVIGNEKGYNKLSLWYSTRCWLDANVSRNANGFLVLCDILDYNIFVLKGSNEYEKLEYIVEHDGNNESVERLAIEVILKHISGEELINAINTLKEKSYNEGYQSAQCDIRKALGIEH